MKQALGAAAVVLCFVFLAAPAGAQTAQDPAREAYIAEADPICKAAFSKRSRSWGAVGRNIGRMARKLDRIPKPPADAERLERWTDALRRFGRLSMRLGGALQREKPGPIRKAVKRLNDAQDDRLDESRGYGFEVCR